MNYRLLLLALLLPGKVFAQAVGQPTARSYWRGISTAPGTTSFGLKGGPGRSDLQSTTSSLFASPFDYLQAFQGGLYGRQQFTHFAAGQAELQYVRKGFRGSAYNYPSGSTPPANHLAYLALPVLFVGNLSSRLSFHLGPQVALLLAASHDGQQLDLGRSGYRRFDLGGVLGAELRAGPTRLGGRFDYSLRELNPAGIAVTTAGQSLPVLGAGNNYHSLVLQAYLSFALHTLEPSAAL